MKPSIFKSRKFLIALMDAIISTLSIVLAFFLAKEVVGQVMIIVAIWQPVIAAWIYSIAVEDAAAIQAGLYKGKR